MNQPHNLKGSRELASQYPARKYPAKLVGPRVVSLSLSRVSCCPQRDVHDPRAARSGKEELPRITTCSTGCPFRNDQRPLRPGA